MSNTKIRVGQKLVIGGKNISSSKVIASNSIKSNKPLTHLVKNGETLSHISDRYNVYIKDIKRWNNLSSNTIKVGQKVKVYTTSVPASNSKSSGVQTVYYVVQKGDTLWDIARIYEGVSVNDIIKENNITNSRKLNPGTKLKIPVI